MYLQLGAHGIPPMPRLLGSLMRKAGIFDIMGVLHNIDPDFAQWAADKAYLGIFGIDQGFTKYYIRCGPSIGQLLEYYLDYKALQATKKPSKRVIR